MLWFLNFFLRASCVGCKHCVQLTLQSFRVHAYIERKLLNEVVIVLSAWSSRGQCQSDGFYYFLHLSRLEVQREAIGRASCWILFINFFPIRRDTQQLLERESHLAVLLFFISLVNYPWVCLHVSHLEFLKLIRSLLQAFAYKVLSMWTEPINDLL